MLSWDIPFNADPLAPVPLAAKLHTTGLSGPAIRAVPLNWASAIQHRPLTKTAEFVSSLPNTCHCSTGMHAPEPVQRCGAMLQHRAA